MQKASLIDTTKISLVKTRFQPEGVKLYDLKYERKPFTIYSYGLIDSPAMTSTNFGEKVSFKFKPSVEDYGCLGDLDVFDYSTLIDQELGNQKSFLESGYVLNIKLAKNQNGSFRVSNNVGLSPDNVNDVIVPGKPVTAVLSVHLYVQDATTDGEVVTLGDYGIYLTLTDLQFDKEEPVKKTVQRKTK